MNWATTLSILRKMAKTTTFHFKKPGLLTQVQDMGRIGYQAFGVPVSGVMDRASAQMANWLVGNPPNNPVLEITLLGPQIGIKGSCQIAITGADLSPQIDGRPVPMFESVGVVSGSVISFGKIKNGCRAYLAVRGDWAVKKWLGSCSASANNGDELTPDSIFQKGSILTIKTKPPIAKKILPADTRPAFSGRCEVRVVEGPEFEMFSAMAIGFFFSRSYKVAPDSNRMGYRLDAKIVDFEPDREIISSATIPGTIQVTNAGQPIILMADAQTTGGYPRLANVISADMDKLAQVKPGDEIRFSLVGLEEAGLAYRNCRKYI